MAVKTEIQEPEVTRFISVTILAETPSICKDWVLSSLLIRILSS